MAGKNFPRWPAKVRAKNNRPDHPGHEHCAIRLGTQAWLGARSCRSPIRENRKGPQWGPGAQNRPRQKEPPGAVCYSYPRRVEDLRVEPEIPRRTFTTCFLIRKGHHRTLCSPKFNRKASDFSRNEGSTRLSSNFNPSLTEDYIIGQPRRDHRSSILPSRVRTAPWTYNSTLGASKSDREDRGQSKVPTGKASRVYRRVPFSKQPGVFHVKTAGRSEDRAACEHPSGGPRGF